MRPFSVHGLNISVHGMPEICQRDHERYVLYHRLWRSQGRFLMLCSASPSIGSFLRSATTAFMVAVLMQRALIIGSCKDDHPAAALEQSLSDYFNGNGLDWALSEPVVGGISVALPKLAMLQDKLVVFNRTHALGMHVGSAVVHLHVDEHSSVRYGQGTRMPYCRFRGVECLHCIYRALLVPKPALHALVPRSLRGSFQVSNSRTRPYSVLHVRLGDANMAPPGSKTRTSAYVVGKPTRVWEWRKEQRELEAGFSRSAPGLVLGCFAKLLPGPHVVVSDTEAMLHAAARLGMKTTRALGAPLHFGMRPTPNRSDVDKLFLDWWLLVQAEETASAGFKGNLRSRFYAGAGGYSSQFIYSARVWRTVEADERPPFRLSCNSSLGSARRAHKRAKGNPTDLVCPEQFCLVPRTVDAADAAATVAQPVALTVERSRRAVARGVKL